MNCALLYVLVEPVQWPFIIASFDPKVVDFSRFFLTAPPKSALRGAFFVSKVV